jgi:hypothetical protein
MFDSPHIFSAQKHFYYFSGTVWPFKKYGTGSVIDPVRHQINLFLSIVEINWGLQKTLKFSKHKRMA